MSLNKEVPLEVISCKILEESKDLGRIRDNLNENIKKENYNPKGLLKQTLDYYKANVKTLTLFEVYDQYSKEEEDKHNKDPLKRNIKTVENTFIDLYKKKWGKNG